MDHIRLLYMLACYDDAHYAAARPWLPSLVAHPGFIGLVRTHRIGVQAYRTLRGWLGQEAALPRELIQRVIRKMAVQRFYDWELAALEQAGVLSAGAAMFMKGKAMRQWYPARLTRQSNDVDLAFDQPEEFWAMVGWLRRRGYEEHSLGLMYPPTSAGDAPPVSLAFVKPLPGADDSARFQVSLHSLPLTLRQSIDLRPVVSRSRQARAAAGESGHSGFFLYPTREDCLLLLLLETSERDELFARDLVDFSALIDQRAQPALDWPAAAAAIDEHGLGIQFLRVAQAYAHAAGLAVPEPVAALCRRWGRRYPGWSLIARNALLAYTLPALSKRMNSLQVGRILWEELSDRLVDYAWARAIGEFCGWHAAPESSRSAAYLLLLDEDLAGEQRLVAADGGDVLMTTPAGTYLVSRTTTFDEDHLDWLRATLAPGA